MDWSVEAPVDELGTKPFQKQKLISAVGTATPGRIRKQRQQNADHDREALYTTFAPTHATSTAHRIETPHRDELCSGLVKEHLLNTVSHR